MVVDTHVQELLTEGAVLMRSVLQYVFSPEDERLAVAAVAARLLDERAVCHVVGPGRTIDCLSPPFANGMVGVAWISPSTCIHCDRTVDVAELPAQAIPALEASLARGEELLPGDLLAFVCGPITPPPVKNDRYVWLFAPSYFDASAAFIDSSYETRIPTSKDGLTNLAAQTPYTHDTSKCRTGPLCWIHGPNTRCVCDPY